MLSIDRLQLQLWRRSTHLSCPDWIWAMPFWWAVQRLSLTACCLSWMQHLDVHYRSQSSSLLQMQCMRNFIGYQDASRFISSCAKSSVTVWLALHQPSFKNSCSWQESCIASAATVVLFRWPLGPMHCNRQVWSTGIHCGWSSALELFVSYYMSHQHQHVRLFQTRTEDVPVSMSGHLVADDSISEELLWRGLWERL